MRALRVPDWRRFFLLDALPQFTYFTPQLNPVWNHRAAENLAVLCLTMSNAEIKVLSAGAVSPGMVKVIDAFQRETGHHVKVTFATAPAILKCIGSAEPLDAVVGPPAVLDGWVKAGKADPAPRVIVGRIGVGVMVCNGAPLPKIATVDEFKQSLLSTQSVVYNQASTGIYLEKLFDRLGISEQVNAKTTRYPDAAAVLGHISKGNPNEIGLGATTVILEGETKGLKFVGPLPAEIQNYTTYVATVIADGAASATARAFLGYMTTVAARKIFAAAGIE
jgi:molybdate transport system substrate-binding protein